MMLNEIGQSRTIATMTKLTEMMRISSRIPMPMLKLRTSLLTEGAARKRPNFADENALKPTTSLKTETKNIVIKM